MAVRWWDILLDSSPRYPQFKLEPIIDQLTSNTSRKL